MRKIFRYLKRIIYFFSLYVLNRIIAFIPCNTFRKLWYRICGMKIGTSSQIDMGVYILAPMKISIGSYSHINQGCLLDGRGGISIGNSVSISHRVQIMTGTHDIQSKDFRGYVKPVFIGDYAFIGVGATVLGGIKIGKGAVVCAGAVVTKSIPDFAVVAGVPSKIIGQRNYDLDYVCTPDRWFM